MTPLDAALDLVRRGWNPVPVERRAKKPIGEGWQKRIINASNAAQFFNGAAMNIGVALGATSHGLTDIDLDAPEAIAIAPYILPRTGAIFGRPSKRNSHCLFYTTLESAIDNAVLAFDDPTANKQKRKDGRLVELRIGGHGHGAQTVVPPSIHPSGEAIKWEQNGDPATVDGEDLRGRVATIAAYSLLARYWPSEGGGHHDAARVVGGLLSRLGIRPPIVRVHVEAIGKAAGSARWKELARTAEDAAGAHAAGRHAFGLKALRDTFGEEIANRVAEWLAYDGAGEPREDSTKAPRKKKRTPANVEDTTALDFAQTHAHNFRYVARWSRWLKWHGNRWRFEDTLNAFDESRKLCRQAGDARARTVAAVERLARADRALAAFDNQWDRDSNLINAVTVTIDLRTGMTRTPDRADYITKMAAVDPAPPGQPHPIWSAFLRRVTSDDPELIGFLQRYLGYCLTGHTHEHVLAFLYGKGANGKGVFVNTVQRIFGDYGITAPMEMFLASRHDRHPTEIARLCGARLVTVQETQKGRAWDEAKLKVLTSEDKLTGHFMRQDFFDFDPTHKLIFTGNHKPTLRSTDEAMRRRFLLIPFTVEIPLAERDPDLPEKLKAEWPAIFRWMVDGCLDWRRNDLAVPMRVRQATDDYLSDQDSLGEWIAVAPG